MLYLAGEHFWGHIFQESSMSTYGFLVNVIKIVQAKGTSPQP